MKARHPSARTGGTRYFAQFSASRGPVALRSWGEFGRAGFPSRGYLVRSHHCQGQAVARGSEQSCPINRWLTQPNRGIARHPHLAIMGRHLVDLGLLQYSHLPPCPYCSNCSVSGWFQHITKTDSVGTSRRRSSRSRPPAALPSFTFSFVTYAYSVNG